MTAAPPTRWRTPAVVIGAGCLIGLVSFGLRSSAPRWEPAPA